MLVGNEAGSRKGWTREQTAALFPSMRHRSNLLQPSTRLKRPSTWNASKPGGDLPGNDRRFLRQRYTGIFPPHVQDSPDFAPSAYGLYWSAAYRHVHGFLPEQRWGVQSGPTQSL